MSNNVNKTIPIFDCIYDMDKHLEFYTALGFEIIYYQKSPYKFSSVKNEFTEISFFGDKTHDINGKTGGCYIVVNEVQEIFNSLKANLKKYYGKIPLKGIPRISRLNKTSEDLRFNITDPSGNTLMIGEPFENPIISEEENLSEFEKLYNKAYRFAYSKEDLHGAINTIKYAFSSHSKNLKREYKFKGLVILMDCYFLLEKFDQAKEFLKEIESLKIKKEESCNFSYDMERFLEIKEALLKE